MDYFHGKDGTRLQCQSFGTGKPIVLANGLGGTFHAWRHLYRHLGKGYHVISWDYRCTHGSAAPTDNSKLDVSSHVDDLDRLLAHFEVERAVFLGWSAGVQINFELYRRHPGKFAAIGALDGTAGRAFEAVDKHLITRAATAAVLEGLNRFGGAIGSVARIAAKTPNLVKLMKMSRLVGPSLDEAVFYDLCRDYAKMDFTLYGKMLELLDHHDAWDVLPDVRVPATIVVGAHDFMTPVETAGAMCHLLPDCELVVLPNCTHYAAVENPEAINKAVDRLLARASH